MNILKATGLHVFVQMTIARETKRLLTCAFFTVDEREDIIQELILYYFEKFHRHKYPSEAYVVVSLKNQAIKLIRTKARQRFGLFVSLEDIKSAPEELTGDGGFVQNNLYLFLEDLTRELKAEELSVLSLVQAGYSLDEIALKHRISKNTIYKLFKKIKEKDQS